MDVIYKIAACSILSVILIVTVRKGNPEIALALSLAACAVMLFVGMQSFRRIWEYLTELGEAAEILPPFLASVARVCGVCILTQIAVTFCQEAGEGAVGKVVELCGSAAAVCAMMPLLESTVEMMQELLGG